MSSDRARARLRAAHLRGIHSDGRPRISCPLCWPFTVVRDELLAEYFVPVHALIITRVAVCNHTSREEAEEHVARLEERKPSE